MNDPVVGLRDRGGADATADRPRDLLVELSVVEYLSAGRRAGPHRTRRRRTAAGDIQRRGVLLRRCAGSGSGFHLAPAAESGPLQRTASAGRARPRRLTHGRLRGTRARSSGGDPAPLLAAETGQGRRRCSRQHGPDMLIGTRWRAQGCRGPAAATRSRRGRAMAMSFAAERLEAGDRCRHTGSWMAFGPGDARALTRSFRDRLRHRRRPVHRGHGGCGICRDAPGKHARGGGGERHWQRQWHGTARRPGTGGWPRRLGRSPWGPWGRQLGLGELREAGARLSEGLALTRQTTSPARRSRRAAGWPLERDGGATAGAPPASPRDAGPADGWPHARLRSEWAEVALAEVHSSGTSSMRRIGSWSRRSTTPAASR